MIVTKSRTMILPDSLVKTCAKKLNYSQVRTAVYHQYKHGPTKSTNPEPTMEDYKKWAKAALGREGREFIVSSMRASWKRFQMKRNIEPGKVYIFEHFNNNDFLKEWKVGADSDSGHGYSSAELVRSTQGHALFRGTLVNRIPEDGLTENSGFVGLMGPSPPKTKFFQLESSYNWTDFNKFEIRFRGDGRKYNVVINTGSYFNDLQFYDNFSYPLYTRGGPYWQTIRIPFQKFVFTYKNMAQDASPLPAFKVKFLAITLQDRVDGPFSLEIDYMGLRNDYISSFEGTPYETYSFPHIRFRQVTFGCDPPES